MSDDASISHKMRSSPEKIDHFLDQFTDVAKLDDPDGARPAEQSRIDLLGSNSPTGTVGRFCPEASTPVTNGVTSTAIDAASESFQSVDVAYSHPSVAPAVSDAPRHRFETDGAEDFPTARQWPQYEYESLHSRLARAQQDSDSLNDEEPKAEEANPGPDRAETFRELLDKIRDDLGEFEEIDGRSEEDRHPYVTSYRGRTDIVVIDQPESPPRHARRFGSIRSALAASIVAAAAVTPVAIYWEEIAGGDISVASVLTATSHQAETTAGASDGGEKTTRDQQFAFAGAELSSAAGTADSAGATDATATRGEPAETNPQTEPAKATAEAPPRDQDRYVIARIEERNTDQVQPTPPEGAAGVSPSAILISGLPADAVLSVGTRISETSWGLLPSQLKELQVWLGPQSPDRVQIAVSVFGADGALTAERVMHIERVTAAQSGQVPEVAEAQTIAPVPMTSGQPREATDAVAGAAQANTDTSDITPPKPTAPVMPDAAIAEADATSPANGSAAEAAGPDSSTATPTDPAAGAPERPVERTARPNYALGKSTRTEEAAKQPKSIWDAFLSFEPSPAPDWAQGILKNE